MSKRRKVKETAIDRMLKFHKQSCTVHVYSGDRHCSCGRDEAIIELTRLRAIELAHTQDVKRVKGYNMDMKYKTILADPPWKYGKWGSNSGRTDICKQFAPSAKNLPLPYPSMSLAEISALPIPDLAEVDCELYVWTTQKYLEYTFPLIRGWGFKVCETLTWCKEPRGTGQGGLFTPTTEFIVHGRIGKMPQKQRLDTTWWKVTRPNVHSRKPESFQDIIEQVSDAPRLEMFARRYRLGWDVWGNEVMSNIDIEVGINT